MGDVDLHAFFADGFATLSAVEVVGPVYVVFHSEPMTPAIISVNMPTVL